MVEALKLNEFPRVFNSTAKGIWIVKVYSSAKTTFNFDLDTYNTCVPSSQIFICCCPTSCCHFQLDFSDVPLNHFIWLKISFLPTPLFIASKFLLL